MFLSFYVADTYVGVMDSLDPLNLKEINRYKLDYSQSVEENVFLVGEDLKRLFPRLIQKEKTEEKYSPEELNEMVIAGIISLDEATTLVKEKITHWRVDKVFIKKDEILLTNLVTLNKHIFNLKTPVSVFLKHILEGNYKPEKAGGLFFSKVITSREIKSEASHES